ncbi:helix-turn-helix transcriptional regulator [Streptomyces sp. NPDC004647]|uniref:helix-turn-helix transcriptional regulator n=1 Tax=Streptomyces sp. NPDC004647 TaxID=3154671 RepID=UPI0033BB6D46
MTWFASDESSAETAGARLARHAATSLAGLLAERGISRSDLAKQMGVSPGRVSQILSGDANLTMRSLASAAAALGASVEIKFFDPSQPLPSQAAGYEDNGDASPLHCGFAPSHR